MRQMSLVCVVVVAFTCAAGTPVTLESQKRQPEDAAKTELEALKKRLPKLLDSGTPDDGQVNKAFPFCSVEVRVARLTPTTAKITLIVTLHPSLGKGSEARSVVWIFLSFCDGKWTTDRTDAVWGEKFVPETATRAVRYLTLAIDETQKK
jgi:hypothetical protein